MAILVLDASVIFDLERGKLLTAALSLPHTFVTPDLLYANELESDELLGPMLLEIGLQVVGLEPAEVEAAQQIARVDRRLSKPDCWAVVLARREEHRLICGDANLRARCESEGVGCSGLLWLLDCIHEARLMPPADLAKRLSEIVHHRRARLPRAEVDLRMARWMAESDARAESETTQEQIPTSELTRPLSPQ